MSEMKAILVEKYGEIENLVSKTVPRPQKPQGYDIIIDVKAVSVNPVDVKVRGGVYDDYPDYYDHVPHPYQIIGFDGAGVVEETGPEVKDLHPGDEVFYSGSPIRQGSNAEFQVVDSRSVAKKPKSLDFVQAAAMPLTYVTAYEALVERLDIQCGENAGLLIINGSGGVGSVASQIARTILKLPAIVSTASRPETIEFCKSLGATHTINHREALPPQIKALNLPVPIKYIFITHTTSQYMAPCAEICAPFGRVCSVVQTKNLIMYGTEFMAKSLTFVWELLSTKPYYGVDLHSHGKILQELAELVDKGEIKTHLRKRLPLTLDGLREGHRLIEGGRTMGKNALGVDEKEVTGNAFS